MVILIIPQKFEKTLGNEIMTEEIVIEGRNTMKRYKKFFFERSSKVYADIFGGRKS